MKANIRTTHPNYYNARIYVGAREGKDGPEITREKLVQLVAEFQKSQMVPVRITPTTYVAGDYIEDGFEIGVTAFSVHEQEAGRFVEGLAAHLMHTLKQTKVGVSCEWHGPYVGQFGGTLTFLEDLNAKCCET